MFADSMTIDKLLGRASTYSYLGQPLVLRPMVALRGPGNAFLLEFGFDARTATGRRAAASAEAPQALLERGPD